MPEPPPSADRPPMAIPLDDEDQPSRLTRFRAALEPAWTQARQNLRVWVPWLATRRDGGRRVRVASRDHRTGLNWEVALPRQCWYCATTESLEPCTFEREVRTFEFPLQIAGVAVAVSGLFFLLTCLWWGMAVLSLLALAVGGLVLVLKSWREQVRVEVWSCAEHRAALRPPEMVIFDDLTLLLGSESLAQAARDHLRPRPALPAARDGERAAGGPTRPSTAEVAVPSPFRPRANVELPKIKLAGDEDNPPEESAGA